MINYYSLKLIENTTRKATSLVLRYAQVKLPFHHLHCLPTRSYIKNTSHPHCICLLQCCILSVSPLSFISIYKSLTSRSDAFFVWSLCGVRHLPSSPARLFANMSFLDLFLKISKCNFAGPLFQRSI